MEEPGDEDEHEVLDTFMGLPKELFQLAECFGGPVDGTKLPVPFPEAGTIISGYNHDTGDMMHYRLVERGNEETGKSEFIYQFMECVNAPDLSFDEFMEAIDEYDEEHNADKYEEDGDDE